MITALTLNSVVISLHNLIGDGCTLSKWWALNPDYLSILQVSGISEGLLPVVIPVVSRQISLPNDGIIMITAAPAFAFESQYIPRTGN